MAEGAPVVEMVRVEEMVEVWEEEGMWRRDWRGG